MQPQEIRFSRSKLSQWAGMGNFILVSPDGKRTIDLPYEGEPPHGDSYHTAVIDGHQYPGYVWGCVFAFSSCSRYVAFSAMPAKYERRTAVVDLGERRYFLLPEYIYDFSLTWPTVVGRNSSSGKTYTFSGKESWLSY